MLDTNTVFVVVVVVVTKLANFFLKGRKDLFLVEHTLKKSGY